MSTKRTSSATDIRKQRVLVTRSAEQAPALVAALEKIGLEPVSVPTIEIVPPGSYAPLDQAIAELGNIDFLILTSTNAVDAFFERLEQQGQSLPAQIKTVAVGPKSAAAMLARGLEADLIPMDYRAEGVVDLLKNKVPGKRVLYPKAGLARDLIPAELGKAGAEVIAPVAYTSASPTEASEKLLDAMREGLDLLTFTASSTVDNFVNLLNEADLVKAKQIPVASIGPLTTDTAEKLGFTVAVEPDNSTLDDMVEAIARYFAQL
jgi:uroporphyrinogen III methyltransferase/synthase